MFDLYIAAGIVCVLLLAAPVIYFVWMHTSRLQERDADALIILGYRCDDGQIHPFLQDRLDTSIRLMEKRRYQRVILSGGAVASSRSEAEIMRDYLIRRGIREEQILLEQRSRNTVQNMVNCKILMVQYGLETCLLVSNSFHIRRMKYIMKDLGISASFYANRHVKELFRQWRITFQEIRAFRLTLPWLAKARKQAPGEMMGKAVHYERGGKA
ncbi:YdcF family protein [Paenibacillus mesophilus]|uniref:YdcF family protein n=1 Tax=Paenibacillus mesophilus TaxID=2582849 RepID=UPI00110EE93F|nr:YdcF family protein [Paenibacillus mesophilus]TMV43893.1 YdcF family protein [Paenibacillus mesophilus]